MNEDLALFQQAVDDFLHAAVHDIRGPLGQVRALVVLLDRQHKDSLDADGRQLCTLIESASRRAVEVVDSIYAFTRILESPVFGKVDLNAIVDAACFSLQANLLQMEAAITRGDLGFVRGDSAKLLLLFEELFRNALKFHSDRAPRIHCAARLCVENSGSFVLVSVVDNGVGISPKDSEAVFKPLKRLHGWDNEGTGMGLAICRRILGLHGGKIWVETSSDGGAEFRFTLPEFD